MTDSTTSDRTKAAVAIASLFGVGAQSYDANKPRATKEEEEEISVSTEEAGAPEFDPNAPFEEVEALDEGEEDLLDTPEFDPNATFDITTESNLEAKAILEQEFGFEVTDEGIRSREEQERYYRTSKGVSKPGTSTHEFGNAIDIKVPSDVSPAEVKARLEARGYYGVKIITKQHGTGPHWHIQWEGVTE